MSVFTRIILFFSSYVPLFVFLTILNTFGFFPGDIVTAAMAFLGIIGFFRLLSGTATSAPQNLTIRSLQPRDGDFIGYTLTYIVPFLVSQQSSVNKKVVFALLLALLCFMYIKSEFFYINPLFALKGYRLFQVTTSQGASAVLITPKPFIQLPVTLSVYRLANFVFLEKNNG